MASGDYHAQMKVAPLRRNSGIFPGGDQWEPLNKTHVSACARPALDSALALPARRYISVEAG
jgi:hypothetical protein